MKSLLIVDGCKPVAELFAEAFGQHGWAVRAYNDAQRAANDLEGHTPCVAVILSQHLPGMTGVELITRIRALDHRKDVPIVMVTGMTGEDMRVAAMAAGADDVWCKPVDITALVAAVRQRVDAMSPQRERALHVH
jgi:two-component system, chemotaxis family, chemotaxis protein CheY